MNPKRPGGTPLGELPDCFLEAHIEYRSSDPVEHRNQAVYDQKHRSTTNTGGKASRVNSHQRECRVCLLIIGQLKEDGRCYDLVSTYWSRDTFQRGLNYDHCIEDIGISSQYERQLAIQPKTSYHSSLKGSICFQNLRRIYMVLKKISRHELMSKRNLSPSRLRRNCGAEVGAQW